MIRIAGATGDVIIQDRSNSKEQQARAGLTLDAKGDYLIATAQGATADIDINGKIFKLGASSYLRVGPGVKATGKHDGLFSGETKTFLGKVWMKVQTALGVPEPKDDLGARAGAASAVELDGSGNSQNRLEIERLTQPLDLFVEGRG